MRFSTEEIKDILKAWVMISVAFTILLSRNNFSLNILGIFLISLLTVGFGFLFHELGHKFVAQRYKYFAEFKADNKMLIVSIVSAFFGFLFAAPGGVYISGGHDYKKLSNIASAGPIINIILAIIFLLIGNLDLSILKLISNLGFSINSWLALFNLIPVFPFDGGKIYQGNKKMYFALVLISFSLVVLSFR